MEVDPRSLADCPRISPSGPSKRQRSRVTNGALLCGIDGRSAWVRRCKDLVEAYVSDQGGYDNLSTAELTLIRRCAVLATQCEKRELDFAEANGAASDNQLLVYQTAVNTLRRTLESVGIRRRAKTVGPSLGDLLHGERHEHRPA